jgi:carbamoyltransferase
MQFPADISGILNTSFNLHGFPIVGSPEDAIETLINSNLDYIAIENYLIQAKQGVQPNIE